MSERLKKLLAEANLNTLTELANKSGINKGTLSKYFRGLQRPSIDVIEPLSDALKVSPTTLLFAFGAIKKDKIK